MTLQDLKNEINHIENVLKVTDNNLSDVKIEKRYMNKKEYLKILPAEVKIDMRLDEETNNISCYIDILEEKNV